MHDQQQFGLSSKSSGTEALKMDKLKVLAVSNFFVNALETRQKGNEDLYLKLVQEIRALNEQPSMDIQRISQWLLAFIRHVSLLNQGCRGLVEQILGLRWVSQNNEFAELFHRFVTHLVSAHPAYASEVINMISSHFLQSNHSAQTPQEVARKRLHLLLKEIILLVPTSTTFLCKSLVSSLPHKWQSVEAHVSFTEHLLLVSRYIPMLRDQLLSALMNRILQLDAEIQVEIEDLKALAQEEMFDIELTEPSDEDEDSEDSDEDAIQTSKHASPRTIEEMVKKLDGMLKLILEYVQAFDYSQPEGFGLFYHMVHIFTTSVLRTFKSRYAQFVMFYLSSLQPQFADAFLGVLFDKLTSEATPRVTRMASAAYLSSFTARAKFLNDVDVVKVATLLLNWLRSYMETTPAADIRLDFNGHALFYAVTQAVLYLFCFRWRSFKIQPEEWDPSIIPLRHILHSSFRPLKVCNGQLVEQFAQLSQQLGFMYCYSIIESDSKLVIPSTSSGERTEVEAFFPFDPYQLESSSHFFDGIYLTWAEASTTPTTSDGPLNEEANTTCESLPSPLMALANLSPAPAVKPRVIKKPSDLGCGFVSEPHHEAEFDLGSPMLSLSLSPIAAAPAWPQHWAQG